MKNASRAALPPEPTHYLNVDLDIHAGTRLEGLVQALGHKVFVLHVGGARRKYEAHVELASSRLDMSADDTILGLIGLIRGLPRMHRTTWESAKRREFNVGIEAGLKPHGFELHLKQRTVRAISDVGGTVVITVYAPDLGQAKPTRQRRKKR